MDGLNEVESVASVAVESSFVTCPVAGTDEILVGTRDFGGGGVEESSDEGNKEEAMVGVVGSDVFVDVVSGNHGRSRAGLGEASDVFVDAGGGNHGTYNSLGGTRFGMDTNIVRNDAAVEDTIGLNNVRDSGDQVSCRGDGEVVETQGVESSLGSNAETSIVVMPTEVELRKEVEDQCLVDGVRDEVEDGGLVDKEVVTGLEMVKEGIISCVRHSSHGGVLDDEAWNPGIVSVSTSCSVMLDTDAVHHEIVREESIAIIQVNKSSLDDEIMSVHQVIETAEVSVLDSADQASTCLLMIGTDGGQQQEGASVPQEATLSLKDDIPGAPEMAETSCEVGPSMVEESNLSSKHEIPVVHTMADSAYELSGSDNPNHTSALCSLTLETDEVHQEEGAAIVEESSFNSTDEIQVAHEMAETAPGLSIPENSDHTSASGSPMLETDGGYLEVIRDDSMLEDDNSTCKDENVGVHEMVETASELSVPNDANHAPASCSVKLETDGVQNEVIEEEDVAMLQENDLSSKDEIPVVRMMADAATEPSVSDNPNNTSASCSLTLEADGVQQEEGAAIVEESNLNSKDEIPVAHEMAETATELSVPENSDHTSASCSPMLETDGRHLEVIRDVEMMEDNNSTCKDENVGVHEMVATACELSVPDDDNHTSASCSVKLETDGVQNEVFKEEDVLMLQDQDSSFKDEIPGVHETAPQVMNDSQVIDTNGTHDKSDGDSVSAFHHDASRCEVKAVDCMISPSSDQKDVNFGIHCSVEDSMEVSGLAANPDLSSQHDLQIKIGSDIEQEEVPESHVESDVKPDNENRNLCSAENNLSMKQDISCGSAGGEDIVPESTHELLSDVDRGDLIVMDYEDVLDVKGEATSLDAPMKEICCTGNTGDFSGVPMTGDKELAQSDLSMLEVHEQVVTGDTEALASKEDKNLVGLSVGNKFQQETEKFDALDGGLGQKAITENTVVTSGEQVITTAACSVRSHGSIIKEEIFSGRNPQSAVEMLATSGTNSTVEGSVPSETEIEDELIQANQISGHKYQRDNKVCAEEPFGSPNSHVECKNEDETAQANQIIGHEDEGVLGAPESHVHISADSIDEGNGDGVFQDRNQNMDMNADVQEDETMETSICEVASSAEVSNQISSHELHGDDKISVEGACGLPASLVKTSDECSAIAEGNNDSVFPYGSQKLNIIIDIQESETMEAPICEVASSAGGSGLVIGREGEDPKTIGEDNLLAVLPQASSVDDQLSLVFGEHYADRVLNDSRHPMTSEGDTCGMNQSEILEEGNIQSSSQPSLVVGEQYADRGQDDREETMGVKNYPSEMDPSEVLEEEKIRPSNPLSVHQSGYFGPPETDGEFSVSDIVWGKVRSHPWWPGQIFDPSDASDRAVKYIKKDSYLVAYFGDGTFAWNDASVLKPFRPHFSQIVKQRNSEVMRIAINSALDEVSRRVELGLSCSCSPKNVYEKIECQIVENAGIREESSRRYGVDETGRAALFEPDKLLEHIRVSARSPLDLSDRLELAIAKAQLSSFCHFKGYRPSPLFESIETSFEDDPRTLTDKPDGKLMDAEPVSSGTSPNHRQKESLKDSLQTKKERSLSELMVYTEFSPDEEDGMDGKPLSKSVGVTSGKKRKAVDSGSDGSDRRVSIYAAKVSTTLSSPKPSFKVGDCIRRAATQLTGAASGLKSNNGQQPVGNAFLQPCNSSPGGNVNFSPESSTLGDMLSQLQLAARDPKKAYGLVKNINVFFSDFRKSVVSKHAVGRLGGNRKRKAPQAVGGSTEEFEFDDVNDSYWKDKAIENYTDEQLLLNGDKSDDGYQPIVSRPAKMHKPARRSYTRKQYSTGSYGTLADEPMEDDHSMKQDTSPAPAKIHKPTRRSYTKKQYSTESYETLADEPLEVDQSMKRDTSPAELIMKFVEGSHIPSQISLNNMFRRFGPLKEYETKVDQDSCRARVIFKKGADAEVAYSSAGTFNIFGSMNVTYQLSYSPSSTLFEMPLLISQGQEDQVEMPK